MSRVYGTGEAPRSRAVENDAPTRLIQGRRVRFRGRSAGFRLGCGVRVAVGRSSGAGMVPLDREKVRSRLETGLAFTINRIDRGFEARDGNFT